MSETITVRECLEKIAASDRPDNDRLIVMAPNPASYHYWTKPVGHFTVGDIRALLTAPKVDHVELVREARTKWGVKIAAAQAAMDVAALKRADQEEDHYASELEICRDALADITRLADALGEQDRSPLPPMTVEADIDACMSQPGFAEGFKRGREYESERLAVRVNEEVNERLGALSQPQGTPPTQAQDGRSLACDQPQGARVGPASSAPISTYAEAEERMRLCGDSILHDPILAGGRFTMENVVKSQGLQVDGTINSASHHAAMDIAQHLRGLAGGRP